MRHLFILDPLELLLPDADTSIAFMREAASRGHHVDSCEMRSLGLGDGARPRCTATSLEVRRSTDWYRADSPRARFLDEYDVVWMRKDPPFDQAYFYATHILDLVATTTLVVNDPRSLRDANEKLFALRFHQFCPPTCVSKTIAELLDFREQLGGEMVVKPLDGAGGSGVFHITREDRNAVTILELGTRQETEYLMAQRYLPEVRVGDKRVIMVEGEPLGAVLRVPTDKEARANFHAGGSAQKTELSARDREICGAVGPVLREMGIVFAGLDVIGEWLTEINITSPTGIREIAELDGIALERDVLDAVERRVSFRRSST